MYILDPLIYFINLMWGNQAFKFQTLNIQTQINPLNMSKDPKITLQHHITLVIM